MLIVHNLVLDDTTNLISTCSTTVEYMYMYCENIFIGITFLSFHRNPCMYLATPEYLGTHSLLAIYFPSHPKFWFSKATLFCSMGKIIFTVCYICIGPLCRIVSL